MTRHTQVLKLLAAGCLLLGLTATAKAADPNGVWKWKFATQNGQEFELSLKLKAEGDKLTGAVTLPMGDEIEIKNGAFKDDQVSFETSVERNGNTFTTKYKGKVDGDTIKGTTERERNGEVMSREWEAKREKK